MNLALRKQSAPDPLITAYNAMLERVHAIIGQPGNRVTALRSDLAFAREKAIELSELTREDAELVATYLERDIQDAAKFIATTGDELHKWWQFDVEQVETRLLEMFSQVADQTSLQMRAMNTELQQDVATYQAGQITGPGTLVCHSCGQEYHVTNSSRIDPCSACGSQEFCRILIPK